MKKYSAAILGLMILAIMLGACSEKKTPAPATDASGYLPPAAETADIHRDSEITVYAGDSLFAYINGGAEIYHSYKFIEVATADYTFGEIDLVLDVYRFENADYAYGLNSALRPKEPEYISLGVEGYIASGRLEFIKGQFLVRLTAYEDTPELTQAMKAFAAEIEKAVPGTTDLPETFSLFPQGDLIDGVDRMLAESFLGQAFLSEVYLRKYQLDGDTVTLFLAPDDAGDKFRQWKHQLDTDSLSEPAPPETGFDGTNSFLIPRSYYGPIIGGNKGGRLVGMVNYHPEQQDDLAAWLGSLP